MEKRFIEIDFARGFAVLGMIFFHTAYDLDYLNIFDLNLSSGFLWIIGRATAIIFLLLVGISLNLSYSKSLKKLSKRKLRDKYIIRGFRIFLLGLVITAATWAYSPNYTIWFGVLHLIGFMIMITLITIKMSERVLILLSASMLLIGYSIKSSVISIPYLLWLGLRPENFQTFDYFPIFPWAGFILFGLFIGKHFYPKGKPKIKSPSLEKHILIRKIAFLGEYSLIIYFIHQPILLLILSLIG